ncbi:hypothetical protein AGMMS49546_19680 [Spirochaetia bacterium]|nr:hypothetical protein AGMMS49546_19680 [Spirochaetia bacterium]
MENIHRRLAALGLKVPEILLPREGIDLRKWAVIACDQFTQDRSYWEQAKKTVGDSPSTLNCVFPEVYLEDSGRAERLEKIHRTMGSYLDEGIFAPPQRSCVYIERKTPYHSRRRGLLIGVDLDSYDWSPEARPLIRATEGTVRERLPPRMEIRREAPLESPHIIILIDDDEDTLLPGIAGQVRHLTPAYQSPLMMNSGSISGWLLDQEDHWAYIAEKIEELASRAKTRYGTRDPMSPHDSPFLYAVGDGNHSLATAKAVWEEYKKAHQGESGLEDHPWRWALVEIENIYDPGIEFEPIHRAIFNADIDDVLNTLSLLPSAYIRPIEEGKAALLAMVNDPGTENNRMGLVSENRYALLETSAPGLATVSLQPLLDNFIQQPPEKTGPQVPPLPSIDYIHGEKDLFRLAEDPSTVGILLPPVRKNGLFETVAQSGPLPRKSFSMGEACEKRFYLECRKLLG